MRRTFVLVLALAVAGCGGGREHGTATIWVTRDRGASVLYTGTVCFEPTLRTTFGIVTSLPLSSLATTV